MTRDETAGRLPAATGGQGGVNGQTVSSRRLADGEANPRSPVASRPTESAGERLARQPLSPRDADDFEELPPPLTGTKPVSPNNDGLGRSGIGREERGSDTSTPPNPSQAISLLSETPGIPTGEIARLTNDTTFRLSYEVESAGPAGVAKVQLWMTEDAGQTWKKWGEDPDCQSPISVEVPGEGVYGFRLVITARNGLAGETPQAGELADMWVEVDRTAPTGELVSAPLGEQVAQGKLIIRWKADDRNLGRRPITLHFSDSPSGPWDVLSAGLANTGQYDWRIVPSLPKLVYLRLEVKDRAGNSHYDQLDRPVDLSTLSPRGTLKGFEIN